MKKVINIIVSVIIAIIIFALEVSIGSLYGAQDILDYDAISNTIQEVELTSLFYEDDGELNELGIELDDVFIELGFSLKESKSLLETKAFRETLGKFVASTVMSTVDDKTEIEYPTKQDLIKVVDQSYDVVIKEHDIKESKEEIIQMIDENYDDVLDQLKTISKKIQKFYDKEVESDFDE